MDQIDLTWTGVFGGEGDGKRRVWDDSERYSRELISDSWDRTRHNVFISMLLKHIIDPTGLLTDQQGDRFTSEAMEYTHDMFCDLNPRLYDQYYDPYSALINFCDCCGKQLNILNRVYYLCETCDDKGDNDNIFNQSTALIIEDLSND